MDASVVFQFLATGFGLIAVMSAAAVVSRSTVLQQNLSQLRNAYTDARAALQDEEKKTARLGGELVRLNDHVKTLEELVTGRPDVAALADEVRVLTGIVRADYAHLAPLAQLLVQEGIARGTQDTSRGGPAPAE